MELYRETIIEMENPVEEEFVKIQHLVFPEPTPTGGNISPAPVTDTLSCDQGLYSALKGVDKNSADRRDTSPEAPALSSCQNSQSHEIFDTEHMYPAMTFTTIPSPEMPKHRIIQLGADTTAVHKFVPHENPMPMTAGGRFRPEQMPDFTIQGNGAPIMRRTTQDLNKSQILGQQHRPAITTAANTTTVITNTRGQPQVLASIDFLHDNRLNDAASSSYIE